MGKQQFYSATTVESLSNVDFEVISLDPATVINAGTSEVIEFYSPEGYMSRLAGMELAFYDIVPATSGAKEVKVKSASGFIGVTRAVGAFDSIVTFQYGEWRNTTSVYPNDIAGALQSIDMCRFDDENSLQLEFENNSNANASEARRIRLYMVHERVT